jgi:hypothetical protein
MRTRLQRLSDAKFFSGWVTDLDDTELRVRLNVSGECEPGDQFLVEIFGNEVNASFKAGLSVSFDNQAYLTILSPIQHRAATESARLSVSDMFGNVTTDETEVDVRVVDISRQGMGIIVRIPLTKGSQIRYKVISPVGELHGQAQVRYCRLDPTGNGLYRVGLRILDLTRVEQAKWHRLVERDAVA